MSFFTTLLGGKLVVGALTVGSVALGGTAAAACTGSLPTALQLQAHTTFGAPAPHGDDGQGDDSAAPAATETPEPSDSAEPTDSPEPTDSAVPTDSPAPTDSPVPTDTTTPAPVSTDVPVPVPTDSATTSTVTVPRYAHGLCTAWLHGGLPITSVAYTKLTTAAGGTDLATWCKPYLPPVKHVKDRGETAGSRDANENENETETDSHVQHEGRSGKGRSTTVATTSQAGTYSQESGDYQGEQSDHRGSTGHGSHR